MFILLMSCSEYEINLGKDRNALGGGLFKRSNTVLLKVMRFGSSFTTLITNQPRSHLNESQIVV